MNKFYLKNVVPKLDKIKMLSLSGATEKDIAEFIGISQKTLAKYKRENAEFKDAVEQKKNSDALVIKAFFKRACGYVAEEETTEFKGKKSPEGEMLDELVVKKKTKKDVPPDLNAIKWWLENSCPTQSVETEEITLEEAREMLDRKRNCSQY